MQCNDAMQIMQHKQHKETMQCKDTTTEGNKATTQQCKEMMQQLNATIKCNN